MHWFLIALAGLLLPPAFLADEHWLRVYLGVLAFACAVAAMVVVRLRE